MNKKKHFFRFLKENNVYYSFLINISSQVEQYEDVKVNVNKILSCLDTKNYKSLVIDSFPWRTTKEGHNFWSNLDDEWLKNCEKIIKKKYNNL